MRPCKLGWVWSQLLWFRGRPEVWTRHRHFSLWIRARNQGRRFLEGSVLRIVTWGRQQWNLCLLWLWFGKFRCLHPSMRKGKNRRDLFWFLYRNLLRQWLSQGSLLLLLAQCNLSSVLASWNFALKVSTESFRLKFWPWALRMNLQLTFQETPKFLQTKLRSYE